LAALCLGPTHPGGSRCPRAAAPAMSGGMPRARSGGGATLRRLQHACAAPAHHLAQRQLAAAHRCCAPATPLRRRSRTMRCYRVPPEDVNISCGKAFIRFERLLAFIRLEQMINSSACARLFQVCCSRCVVLARGLEACPPPAVTSWHTPHCKRSRGPHPHVPSGPAVGAIGHGSGRSFWLDVGNTSLSSTFVQSG